MIRKLIIKRREILSSIIVSLVIVSNRRRKNDRQSDKSKDRFGNRSCLAAKNRLVGHHPFLLPLLPPRGRTPPLRRERERQRDRISARFKVRRKMDRSQYRGPRFDRKSSLVRPVSGTHREWHETERRRLVEISRL